MNRTSIKLKRRLGKSFVAVKFVNALNFDYNYSSIKLGNFQYLNFSGQKTDKYVILLKQPFFKHHLLRLEIKVAIFEP